MQDTLRSGSRTRGSSPGLPKRSRLKAGCTYPPAREGFVWVAGGLSLRAGFPTHEEP
jgi:hypothetical protein